MLTPLRRDGSSPVVGFFPIGHARGPRAASPGLPPMKTVATAATRPVDAATLLVAAGFEPIAAVSFVFGSRSHSAHLV